jgi:hypothetical protein
MGASTLLVTLAIGDRYISAWKKLAEPSWRRYAEIHDYDLRCIDHPLDESDRARRRSVSWQKCLVLQQPFADAYERIVWIDSDIVINAESAPSIVEGVPIEKVGAVDAFSIPSRAACEIALLRCFDWWEGLNIEVIRETTPEEYHANYGFPTTVHDGVVQCGVLVLSPRYHKQLLARTYHDYEDKGGPHWHYEERPLSWELITAGAVHWIDHRFNALWILFKALHYPFLLNQPPRSFVNRIRRRLYRELGADPDRRIKQACVNAAFVDSYFMHFGAAMEDMPLVDARLTSWRQCVWY